MDSDLLLFILFSPLIFVSENYKRFQKKRADRAKQGA